jgi:stage V sporulation protein G
MKITDINIRKVAEIGKLKAYVTVTFDDIFVVHNIKIIQSLDGYFIAMPSRKITTGQYKDVCHPINADFRNEIQSKILKQYNSGNCINDLTVEI